MANYSPNRISSIISHRSPSARILLILTLVTIVAMIISVGYGEYPISPLDLSYQVELLDLLEELQETKGKTIVMVLHDLNLSCRYGDYLVAVQQGKVYATGTPQQVMTEEMVRDVFNLECRIVPDPLANTPMCIPMGRKTQRRKSSLKE